MGVRLIVEVLDHWQDAGLTAGERNDLVVLAENANDGSRLTWGPVHEPYILRRANKTAAGWKNSIGKLIKKGALIQHAQGHVGQVAVYRLVQLCPEARHDGWKGFCSRPERVTPEVTLCEEQTEKGHLTGDPEGHFSGDPFDGESHLTGAERVTSQVTPTPPSPSLKIPSKTPSSLAEVSSPADSGTTNDGGGGDSLQGPTPVGPSAEQGPAVTDPSERSAAEPLVSALDFRGRPPGARQRGKLLALVAAALNSGWTEQDLKTYLDLGGAAVNSAAAVYVHRLTPGELPDPDTYREAVSRPLEGTDAAVAGWMALAGQSGSHTPYRDDTWARLDRDAKEGRRPAGWETVPWCGSCDEITRAREETEDGRTVPRLCGGCHPMMRF